MSIEKSFDNLSEEILKPWEMADKIEDFPEIAVATFNCEIINIVKERPDAEKISELSISEVNAGYNIPVYSVKHKNKNFFAPFAIVSSSRAAEPAAPIKVW